MSGFGDFPIKSLLLATLCQLLKHFLEIQTQNLQNKSFTESPIILNIAVGITANLRSWSVSLPTQVIKKFHVDIFVVVTVILKNKMCVGW